MNKLLAVGATVALALLGTLVPLGATHAADGRPASSAPGVRTVHTSAERELSGTFMVGDSTTWRIEPTLHAARPDWLIDCRRGRPVKALAAHIDAYLRHHPAPANFVMALGTNRSHRPEWSEARLRRAIAKLPARTNVFLVMVVRAGAFQADKDATLKLYNGYSRDLARTRPHTYVIDWRHVVLSDPTLDPVTGRSSLLEDGTHETGGPRSDRRGPGVATYVRLVTSKWDEVNRRR